jgi:hypothetical protein
MYELGVMDIAKAGLAAAVTALPLGVLGAVLLPPQRFAGFFTLAIALLLGFAAGAAVSAVIRTDQREARHGDATGCGRLDSDRRGTATRDRR